MIVGEKIKDNFTGEVFEVKKIVEEHRLLRDEAGHPRDETGPRLGLAGLGSLKWVYGKAQESSRAAGFRR